MLNKTHPDETSNADAGSFLSTNLTFLTSARLNVFIGGVTTELEITLK